MDKNNKSDIKHSPKLKESVEGFKKRYPLTPSEIEKEKAFLKEYAEGFKKRHPVTPLQKRELKALREKIIRIVEITKKTYPGKKGWEYLDSLLDSNLDSDLYPLLRNHVIKLAKRYNIELRIYDNKLYNETIGDEAEEIMAGVFESEYRSSNITDLEHIPLHVVNKIIYELNKDKNNAKHLEIIQHNEEIKPDCIKEELIEARIDTVVEPLILEEQMTIIKEILNSEELKVFHLHVEQK